MDNQEQSQAATSKSIILFDIPTKEPRRCSSQHVWRTRASLNYKGIPYETQWLEYPKIASTLESFGIKKNEPGQAYTDYWCPAVRMPDGTYIMESHNIALALESLHPDPTLHVSSPNTEQAIAVIDNIVKCVAPAYLYRLPDNNFSPESKEWYHRQRAKLFGASLYQVPELEPFSGERPWQNVDGGFQDLIKLLEKDVSGPFVAGNVPSYADFVIGGFWDFLHLVDREGDVYGRVMKMNPSFPEHENACKPWFARASY